MLTHSAPSFSVSTLSPKENLSARRRSVSQGKGLVNISQLHFKIGHNFQTKLTRSLKLTIWPG